MFTITLSMPFIPTLAIFDLDGTLIEYEHEFLFNEAERILPNIGFAHVTRDEFVDHFENDNMFGFIHDEGERKKVEEHFWIHLHKGHRPSPNTIEGALETLDHLASRGIKLAIATARAQLETHLRDELQHTGLLRWVDIITSRDTHDDPWRDKRKQIFLACQHVSASPQESFMVGDSPSDIWSAHAISIGCPIAVRTGRINDEVLLVEKPYTILDHVGELKGIIPFRK